MSLGTRLLTGVACLGIGITACTSSPANDETSGNSTEGTAASGNDVATAQKNIPAEPIELFESEIALVSEPYSPGQSAPTLGNLFPQLVGATSVNPQPNDGTYVAEGSGEDGEPFTLVIAPGDTAVRAALYWQCGWAKEYFDAKDVGNQSRIDAAADALRMFPDLEAITEYDPDLARMQEGLVEPILDGSDDDAGRRFFERECN